MKRIFTTLAVTSNAVMWAAFILGWMIGDPGTRESAGRFAGHFLTAVGGLMFAALVHAIVLTYFMGTGRWLEETSQAYHLGDGWTAGSKTLKYRTLPWMAVALVLLILTGGLGAVADPATPAGVEGFFGVSSATIHLLVASLTLAVNAVVNVVEFSAVVQNGALIEEVLAEVQRIRREKGLPIE